MRISTKGRYGVNAIFMLAKSSDNEPVSLKTISSDLNMPMPYLEQIIIKLRKNGFIKSVRGSKGGYILAKPKNEILIYDLLVALEGEMAPVECKNPGSCSSHGSESHCAGRLVWIKIHSAIFDVLDGYTLEDMVNEYENEHFKG